MRCLGIENDTELYMHGSYRAFLSVKSFCVRSHDLLKNTGTSSLSCILIMKRKERIERHSTETVNRVYETVDHSHRAQASARRKKAKAPRGKTAGPAGAYVREQRRRYIPRAMAAACVADRKRPRVMLSAGISNAFSAIGIPRF